MISILLDTNILYQEGLASGNMQLLKRLVDASYVEVFVPEIVKKEFLSRRILESKEKLKEAANSISLVTKKISKGSGAHTKSSEVQAAIKEIEDAIEENIHHDFAQWEEHLSVTVIPFNTAVMVQVMDDYFSGEGVYRKPKSREDIPDAIINMSILELVNDRGEITVAIKDGAFKKYLSKNESIAIVDSLEEFLQLEGNRQKIAALDSISSRIGKITDYLGGDEFKGFLLSYLTRANDKIEAIYLEEDDISNKDELGIDTYGERINWPQAKTVSDLIIGNIDYLSNDSYFLKLSFAAKATLDYCADYVDYVYLDENTDREPSMESMNGEGVCDLSELFDFRFSGHLEIKLHEGMAVEELRTHSQYLGSDTSPIDMELEIDSAQIL